MADLRGSLGGMAGDSPAQRPVRQKEGGQMNWQGLADAVVGQALRAVTDPASPLGVNLVCLAVLVIAGILTMKSKSGR